ncbi:MAG: PilZ domain-containing protein [Deltaproteobacteria bacterium]|nr:PilZ domain-containing protein [Deltaproteobacteria bacterium]MBW2419589.1 PilZ domain-containing protein [Deltaproteobacteria bacterium]
MPRRTKENTRRFRRKTVRILVDYISDDGVRCDYATTLGAGGLFIETDSPLPVGSLLKLRFRLRPEDELHELTGRVCWTHNPSGSMDQSPGSAIQFTGGATTSRLARELEDIGD